MYNKKFYTSEEKGASIILLAFLAMMMIIPLCLSVFCLTAGVLFINGINLLIALGIAGLGTTIVLSFCIVIVFKIAARIASLA